MVSRCIVFFVMVVSLSAAAAAAAADFNKTWDNAADKRITIFTQHGDIKLSGYDGKNIEISAVKKGHDGDRVEIEDASTGNQINIFSKYLDPARSNATVDFEIRVPKEIFYNAEPDVKPQSGRVFNLHLQRFPGDPPMSSSGEYASPKTSPKQGTQTTPKIMPATPGTTAISPKTPPKMSPSPPEPLQSPHAIYLKSNSGQITISDVSGSIRVETGGRNIEIQNVAGMLYALSLSGDIKVLLKQTSHRSFLQFSSVSGNISVQAPDDISTQVRIQSSTGQVKTDFPLETRETRYGPGKSIQGRLGAGSQMLDIRSVSGAITFSKKPQETKDK